MNLKYSASWGHALSACQADKLVLTLAAMIGLPFVVHALPAAQAVGLGQTLLPIFYAPLWAAVFFRPHVAFTAALFAPTINRIWTGHPDSGTALMLTIELLVFAAIVHALFRPGRHFWGMGILAYLPAKMSSIAVVHLMIGSQSFGSAAVLFWQSMSAAWPGLVVLTLISIMITRRSRAGGNG